MATADAAASYMAAEISLRTWRASSPQGASWLVSQNKLRLAPPPAFLREDWPTNCGHRRSKLRQPILRSKQPSVWKLFGQFRGLAALQGPNRNPEAAKAIFAELFAQRAFLGSAANWFAAAISELLPIDSFALLKGDHIRQGQKAVSEVERMTAQLPATSVDRRHGVQSGTVVAGLR